MRRGLPNGIRRVKSPEGRTVAVRPENSALLAAAVSFVVVTAAVGAFLLLSPSVPPESLPVAVGTEFTWNETDRWVAHFTTGPSGGTLVGAWAAYEGFGDVGPVVVNGTVPKPSPAPGIYHCPALFRWAEINGTVNRPLAPGAYSVYWNTVCAYATQIVVTQTIQVVAS